MNKGQKKGPTANTSQHGKKILCAACHQEITGTPVEKNGYHYHPGHERQDFKAPPRA
ncbi:MAG TPA: hypothetical protein VGD74_04520 [Vulgatibacter sp.]